MKNNVVFEDCKLLLDSRSQINFPSHIFITGASGMLGLYTLEFFLALKFFLNENIFLYINTRKVNRYLQNLINENDKTITNLENSKFCEKMLNCGDDKLLVHSASPSNVASIRSDPESLITTNISQVINYSNIFEKSGGKIIFFSSGEVYGHNPPIPTSEENYCSFNHLEINSVYAESKKTAELIIYLKSLSKKFNFTIFRIFHTFGPGINLNDNRIFGTLLNSLYFKKPIILRSDGSSRRTFMYSGDLLQAILLTQRIKENLILNISGSEEYSIIDIANMASKIVKPNLEIKFNIKESDSMSNNLIKRGLANTDKLRSFGWKPIFNIENAFSRTLQSCIERSSFLLN